jgi:hypothetical protein
VPGRKHDYQRLLRRITSCLRYYWASGLGISTGEQLVYVQEAQESARKRTNLNMVKLIKRSNSALAYQNVKLVHLRSNQCTVNPVDACTLVAMVKYRPVFALEYQQSDWMLIGVDLGGEQSIAIDVVSIYNCMQRFYLGDEALASPSPSRLVVSEPSVAGLIRHRFHQYSNEGSPRRED